MELNESHQWLQCCSKPYMMVVENGFLGIPSLFWGCELFSGGYMRPFIQDGVLSIILTPKFLSLCSFL